MTEQQQAREMERVGRVPPCKECKRRTAHCHAECPAYTAYAAARSWTLEYRQRCRAKMTTYRPLPGTGRAGGRWL